jgi:hypothetical protein
MGDQNDQITQTRDLMQEAIRLVRNCYEGSLKAPFETKRLFNLAFFEKIVVKDREITRTKYQEPFRALFALQAGEDVLNKELMVEVSGFEPPTSALRNQRGVMLTIREPS